MSKQTIPQNLPANAIGFVARRADRPERLAIFLRDGKLNSSFATDQGADEIGTLLAPLGYSLTKAENTKKAPKGLKYVTVIKPNGEAATPDEIWNRQNEAWFVVPV